MNKAIKKPVIIEYIQLTENNIKEVYELIHPKETVILANNIVMDKWEKYETIVKNVGMNIFTLESGHGTQIANINDYIIKDVKVEYYPCKPDIFELTYTKLI